LLARIDPAAVDARADSEEVHVVVVARVGHLQPFDSEVRQNGAGTVDNIIKRATATVGGPHGLPRLTSSLMR